MTRSLGIRCALVHHWFLARSGGERVCEALVEILGDPDFFTLFVREEALPEVMRRCRITPSFLQRVPGSTRFHRNFLPLYPRATESFDLRGYDLVVSSDAATVKGVLTAPGTCHVCYCHSPLRYAWDMAEEYAASMSPWKRALFRRTLPAIRRFDLAAARRVDAFVANSGHVQARIRKTYGRRARVIYPPCDVERFQPGDATGDYYLFVGRLIDYKRPDLAIRAAALAGRKLVVVGDGPGRRRLEREGRGQVEFLGWVPEDDLPPLMAGARALLFPGEEDFGIVPVEMQAAGRPVIAYGRGGALETVRDGETGVFFHEPTPEALAGAIRRLESIEDRLDPAAIRRNAEPFSVARFQEEMLAFLSMCRERHAAGEDDRWLEAEPA